MAETLAGRLRRARDLSKVSARKLSWLADLAAGHVSLIEDARPNLEAQTAAKLARALGVTMDWLVSGTGDEPREDAVLAAVAAATIEAHARDASRAGKSGEHSPLREVG